MPPHGYLHRCLGLFGETMQERYGKRPDYTALEKQLQPVREGERAFTYRDLETIQNPRYGDFRQFWRFPAEGDIVQEINWDHMSRLIQRLPLDEADAITRLHSAFKYIQNVSVVLRFVHPDQYGILSPPVEKILEVRRGATEVETYLHYLRDIRDVRDQHGLPRAADADMALWVLQELVLSTYREPALLASYRADTWLQERRAVNLLAEMSDVGDALDLGRALADVSARLAGMLAAAEFERRLRATLGARSLADLPALMEAAATTRPPRSLDAWRWGLRLRDQIHDPESSPTRAEVLELIELARSLGSPES